MSNTLDSNVSILLNDYEHYLNFQKQINNVISKLKKGLLSVLVIPLAIVFILVFVVFSPLIYIFALYIIYRANRGLESVLSKIPSLPTSELMELQKSLIVFENISESDLKQTNNSTFLLEIVFKPFEALFISLFLKGKLIKEVIDTQITDDLALFEKALKENTLIGE